MGPGGGSLGVAFGEKEGSAAPQLGGPRMGQAGSGWRGMGEGGDGPRSALGNRTCSRYCSCLKGSIEIKMKKIIIQIETKHAEFSKGGEKKKLWKTLTFRK